MTYCLGIMTKEGLVLASDSRTNAGFDQVNTCRKMHQFVQPGERVFVILTSGSLSISQSVVTLLRADFDAGRGLAQANSCMMQRASSGTACAECPTSIGLPWSAIPSASTCTCFWEGRFVVRSRICI